MIRLKKHLSILLSALLVLQLFSSLIGVGSVSASPGTPYIGSQIDFWVTGVNDTPQSKLRDKQRGNPLAELVLGVETEIVLHAKNKAAAGSGKTAYNVGLELVLPDGIVLASSESPSTLEPQSDGSTIAFWKDIKDLAGNEEFEFPVKVKVTDNYLKKAPPAAVKYGDSLPIKSSLYASSDARQLYYEAIAPTSQVTTNVKVVPFSVRIIHDAKNVKGAGSDLTVPVGGAEWGELPYTVKIINNTRDITTFSKFTQTVGGALEVYGFAGATTSAQTVSGSDRKIEWTGLSLTAGASKQLTFKTAYFHKDIVSGVENQGAVITHGTERNISFAYTANVNGVTYTDDALHPVAAKSVSHDIVVYKSVALPTGKSTIGYGDVLKYTLTVKVNEYESVSNVHVKDTIGDGQTFVKYISTPGTVASPTKSGGKTVLDWDLGTLSYSDAAKRQITLEYEVKVDNAWTAAHGEGPIVANDVLVNDVEVSGETVSSGVVKDSDYTEVYVGTPTINERITMVNGGTIVRGSPVNPQTQSVTVGDNVDFHVGYDAIGLQAKQHNVRIYDYLPLGTTLVGDPTSYVIDTIVPTYDPVQNLLIWDWAAVNRKINEGQLAELFKEIKVLVTDNTSSVKKDKGAKNLVKLSYENSDGIVESKRQEVKLVYEEPEVIISRSVNKTTNLVGTDEVTITLTLTNTGTTPAYHVKLTETVPTDLTTPQPFGSYTFTAVGNVLSFAEVPQINPGQSVIVQYKANVINPIGAAREIVLEKAAWTYVGQNDTNIVHRTYNGLETTQTKLYAKSPVITKEVVDTSNDKNNLRVGDWVVYKVDVQVPANTIAYAPSVINEIPNNETLTNIYKNYDTSTHVGTIPVTATPVAGKVTINVPSPAAGDRYTYYYKTTVNRINPGAQEDHQSDAWFEWNDDSSLSTPPHHHSISPVAKVTVTVKAPQLEITLSPNAASMKKGDSAKQFTATVRNKGKNTAYSFTPTAVLPAGFIFGANPNNYNISGQTISFGLVTSLAPNAEIAYTFNAALDHVEGAGSTKSITGNTGDYYSKDTDGTKYDYTIGTSAITVPSVTITNAITATSSGDLTKIRPGDTVDYQIIVTVPKGTQAFDLVVKDTLANLGNFDIVNKPQSLAASGNILTATLENQDATLNEIVHTFNLQLRAKTDKFLVGDPTVYSTSAIAYWNTSSGVGPVQTAPATTSITVVQPVLGISAVAIAAPNKIFNNDNKEISVSFRLTNAGTSVAKNASVKVNLPVGVAVKTGTISDNGVLNGVGNEITWTGLSGSNQDVTFVVTSTTAVSPGSTLNINATLLSYNSRDAEPTKEYTPNAQAQQVLTIAPVTATASITSTTNNSVTTVRPGDEVTYKLAINIPINTTTFNTRLDELTTLTGLTIISVKPVGGSTITPTAEHIFPLGDLVGALTPIEYEIVAKVRTDQSPNQNPYTATYTPILTYDSLKVSGTPKPVTVTALDISVAEPKLSLLLSGTKTQFDEADETITYTLKVTNGGQSPAFNPALELTLPTGVHFVDVGSEAVVTVIGDGTVPSVHFTWAPGTIAAGAYKELVFTASPDAATEVKKAFDIDFTLLQYFSLPNSGGKQYASLNSNKLNVTIEGAHLLNTAPDQRVAAAQDATFEHTLTNTGAGADTFDVSAVFPYSADVYVDGIKVIDNKSAVDALLANIPLPPGGTSTLKWVIHVPEGTPYDNDNPQLINLEAKGIISLKSTLATDKLYIVGSELDGWTGSQARIGWTEPTFAPGDPIKLSATSSNDIQKLKASYVYDGHTVDVLFTLDNPTTYVTDGYKIWSNVFTRLPDDILNGLGNSNSFQVTFEGLSSTDAVIQTDDWSSASTGANNAFTVRNSLIIKGLITDGSTAIGIPEAKVTLYNEDANHLLVATVTADTNGDYNFGQQKAARYSLVVEKEGYASGQTQFFALASSADTEIVVDVALTAYKLALDANPSTIVGDGHSQSRLTATITDLEGNPVAGLPVTFTAPPGKGSFPSGATAVTDANGKASVLFQSSQISGILSERFPVTATAFDTSHNKLAQANIIVTFEPASIEGIVTEMVNGVAVPVSGAVVVISKDFDNDGVIDFTGTAVTGADGKYTIAIPRGNVQYDLVITKPVQVGGHTENIAFQQTVTAGNISGLGNDVFVPNKGATGIILFSLSGGGAGLLAPALQSKLTVRLLDITSNAQVGASEPLALNGTFSLKNVPQGSYKLELSYELAPGRSIIVNGTVNGLPTVQVTQGGELNIIQELIDPYGKITDYDTNAPIEGAHVELYYADTPRNILKGLVPNTPVSLPAIVGFAPNDNASPQDSDAAGDYAFMVYDHTDYYLRVTKPGYHGYISPTISVELDIVRHDLTLSRIVSTGPSNGSGGGGTIPLPGQRDLAAHLYSDKASYEEGSEITYTVVYTNKTNEIAHGVVVQAEVPLFTSVSDAANGSVNGNLISWKIGDLPAGGKGTIVYKVKVQATGLLKAEVRVDNTATITSTDNLINVDDDTSKLQVLLFSKRYAEQRHTRYILGYPDGEFKSQRTITRAEIAAIFARLLDLRSTVTGAKLFPDVEPTFWAGGYIEATVKAGLFSGYEDKTFRPNNAITRAELSQVISKYLKLTAPAPADLHFTDIGQHWAKNAIEEIYRYHIISGYPDGTFGPGRKMIRAEAVAMINRLLFRGPLTQTGQTFPDVSPSFWAFGDVEESVKSHSYKRNSDGSESMTELIPEPIW
ncbi:S-layer homology domain-containing protein [Cohnella abietis]|uniref:Big-1 domain-containing protein n=1 Tax=Cohnella abietis TaxID=2507935 RepID=A0A3T1CYC8_9BACL|nr:S-layer homology domain-containing protein [Cohnella abietis]BBI30811.1 hypothetical protein KCTCHS21_02100 [Cohnella abietis]